MSKVFKVFSGKTYIGYICREEDGYLPHIDYGSELSGLGRFNNKTGAYALSKSIDEAAQKIYTRFKKIIQVKVGKLRVK